jgi:hypothetical protein
MEECIISGSPANDDRLLALLCRLTLRSEVEMDSKGGPALPPTPGWGSE